MRRGGHGDSWSRRMCRPTSGRKNKLIGKNSHSNRKKRLNNNNSLSNQTKIKYNDI